jgi:hypothetical protein
MRAILRHNQNIQQVKASNPISPGGHARFVAEKLPLPAGSWVVFAKADVKNVSSALQPIEIRCFLDIVGPETVEDRSDAAVTSVGDRHTITLMIGTNVPESATIELSCSVDFDNRFEISNIALAAMEVESMVEFVSFPPGSFIFPPG